MGAMHRGIIHLDGWYSTAYVRSRKCRDNCRVNADLCNVRRTDIVPRLADGRPVNILREELLRLCFQRGLILTRPRRIGGRGIAGLPPSPSPVSFY